MANPIPPHQPIPIERSIRWVPAGSRASADIGGVEEHAIFITQDALREIGDDARSGGGEEVLGFLLGERYECPDSGTHYVVISAVVRTGHVIAEEEPVQIPNEEWLGIQLEVKRRHLTLIGWYHTAPFVAPSPARLDLDTQRMRFPEPWQCGLVIAIGDRPAGGFFRAAPGGGATGAFVPFHELLDEASLRAGGARRTLIDWRNYVTDTDVELDEDAIFAPPPFAPPGAPGVATPVLIPSRPEEEDLDQPTRPRTRRARPKWPAALVLVLVAGVAAWLLWGRRPPQLFPRGASTTAESAGRRSTAGGAAKPQIPIPGGVRPASPAASSPSTSTSAAPQTPSSPSAARFDRLADSLQQATTNYHARRSDFDLHRIDCAGLARGYRAADDALIALAALYRDAHGALTAAQITRYTTLVAAMDTVNGDFAGSRCPRP